MQALKQEMEERHKRELNEFDAAKVKIEKDELAKIVAPALSNLQELELKSMFKGMLK